MGFMDKLLGKQPQYAPLKDSDPVSAEYNKAKDFIKKTIQQYKQSQDVSKSHRIGEKSWIEVVASGNSQFLYIGTPPEVFAFTWKDGNSELDFKDYVISKKMDKPTIGKYMGAIRSLSEKYKSAPRFQTELDGSKIIVVDSKEMVEKLLYITKEMQK